MEESRADLKKIIDELTTTHTTTTTTTTDTDDGHNQLITAKIDHLESWPAFALKPNQPLRRAMEMAVTLEHPNNNNNNISNSIPSKVSGPSNVGNLLVSHGVPATTGYGVGFVGMHAPDEHIDLTTISTTFNVYTRAMRHLSNIEEET